MTATTQQTLRDAVARVAFIHGEKLHPDDTIATAEADWLEQRFPDDRAVAYDIADALLAPGGPIAAHIASIDAKLDAAKAKSLPHMCRDEHAEIRHAVNDDDERCPVCRERDGRLAAEAELARLTAERDGMERARVRELEAALADLIDVFHVSGATVSVKADRVLQVALVHARTALRQKDADHA